MSDKVPFYLKLAKYLLAALAAANLAVLFCFPSLLPSPLAAGAAPRAEETDETAQPSSGASGAEEMAEEAPEGTYTLSLDGGLTYDGTGELDLLEGVSLLGPDGSAADGRIFAHIRPGDTLSEKVVEYSADTASGQVRAERSLELVDYAGPVLTLSDDLPEVDDAGLDGLLDTLRKEELIEAEDGYGNDITEAVTADYTRAEDDPYTVRFVFTVTNSFNDTATVETVVELTPLPIITLTDEEVTVPLYGTFNVMSYVADAVDTDGSSLMRYIIVDGDVDTDVAGEYVVTYWARSPSGVTSSPAELRVIVA